MIYALPRTYEKTSRYSIYRQILDDNNILYTETANQIIVDDSELDQFHEVLKEEENRLDIISNKYYGTPDYYWIIAMGNNLIDPFIVKPGDILRIPNFSSLKHWKGALCNRI